MKKVLFIALTIALFSCKKDENKECNCGTITNDGVSDNCYWLEIRNSCSDRKKKFCFDQDVWQNAHVGENFCVTDVTNW
jgi:hypothetical protein